MRMASRVMSGIERLERDLRWQAGRLISTTGIFAWWMSGYVAHSAGVLLGFRVVLGAMVVLNVLAALNAWHTVRSSTGRAQPS
jgi:hypothetical protein